MAVDGSSDSTAGVFYMDKGAVVVDGSSYSRAYETKVAHIEKKKLLRPRLIEDEWEVQGRLSSREWGASWCKQYSILFWRGLKSAEPRLFELRPSDTSYNYCGNTRIALVAQRFFVSQEAARSAYEYAKVLMMPPRSEHGKTGTQSMALKMTVQRNFRRARWWKRP